MGRAERRRWNKKHKDRPMTREDWQAAIMMARIQAGNYKFDDLMYIKNDMVHMDNTELAPDGTLCKLNYDAIKTRPKSDLTEKFLAWVEENKDKEFHITREGVANSLISFEEDVRYTELDGKTVEEPKWLWDTYTDILIQNDEGEWVTVLELDEQLRREEEDEDNDDAIEEQTVVVTEEKPAEEPENE